MSETPGPPPAPQAKKLSLDDLLPAKAPVVTSLGTLYVRHAYASDWKHFESGDAAELGRAAVRQLANRIEDKKEDGPLADEDFDAFVGADFDALAPAIAKQSGWGALPVGPALQGLGQAVKAAKVQEREPYKKMLEDMRKSIGGSYAFLAKGTLEKLQDQVAGLADIRRSLSVTGALNEAMRATGLSEDALKGGLARILPFEETIRGIDRANIPKDIEARRTINMPPIYIPPRPEETPVGRAAIESAQNSREVAQKMDALAAVVGGLNQTLVTEVLPSWFRQVENDQKSAKDSFDHAASGLWWTKWAVIASVVVTILVTWWQVSVARDIDRENSAQQQKAEVLLREQLAVQKRLIEQQGRDAAQLRGLLEQQVRDSEKLRGLLDSKPQTPATKK